MVFSAILRVCNWIRPIIFFVGLLDSITTTEDSKDCPGVCVHALATLICYEVLDEVPCPSSGMKCCVESAQSIPNVTVTTQAPTTTKKTTRAPSKTSKTTASPIDRMDVDGNEFIFIFGKKN